MGEDYAYASEDDFFTWLWEEKLTQEEKEEYVEEFESENNILLPPGFAQ